MSAAQHPDVRPPADEKAQFERFEEIANAIIKYAARRGITPAEAKKAIVAAAKEVEEEGTVDAKPGAIALAKRFKISAAEARELSLRLKLSEADDEGIARAVTKMLETEAPRLARSFAAQGIFSIADAQSAVIRLREQHRADPGAAVTMSQGGRRLLDVDPAAWAREVSARTGAPLSECQAEAARLRSSAAPQPPAGVAARIEHVRQHQVEETAREARELTRQGYSLPEAQAEILRRRASAPPPAPPPPPPPAPVARPQWPVPSSGPSADDLARGERAMRSLQEAERAHKAKLRGGRFQ